MEGYKLCEKCYADKLRVLRDYALPASIEKRNAEKESANRGGLSKNSLN
jgi:hypothetical protein